MEALKTKIADYKQRSQNPLLPASAVAKLNEIIATMEGELNSAPVNEPTPPTDNTEVLKTRLKLLKKMVAKNPTPTLKTRIKIVEKMLTKKMAAGGQIGYNKGNKGLKDKWFWTESHQNTAEGSYKRFQWREQHNYSQETFEKEVQKYLNDEWEEVSRRGDRGEDTSYPNGVGNYLFYNKTTGQQVMFSLNKIFKDGGEIAKHAVSCGCKHSMMDNKAYSGKKLKGPKKVAKVMKEFKSGKLKTSSGKKVTKRKQAVAIALSEADMSNKS